jgi:RimJ/RimL family protein N-acetyltransferase
MSGLMHDLLPRIRHAREEDAFDVVGWFPDRRAAVLWGGPQVADPLVAQWLMGEFNSAERDYYVMVDQDDLPLGVFGLRLHRKEKRAHLVRVAIDPDARGYGLSSALLKGAATLAREARMQRLTLNVYGSNNDARMAYERAGFFPYEFAPAPEDPTGTMLRMLKPL